MKIIEATGSDTERIREITLSAFAEEEGESVAALALALLEQGSTPRPLQLVAEVDGLLVGYVCFSPVGVGGQRRGFGSILAPLAVDPGFQKQGAGSALVKEGVRRCREQGDHMVFVYGDPNYYGRFGFSAGKLTARFLPPCPAKYPFGWQALDLSMCKWPGEPVAIQCVEPLDKPELW